MVACPVGTAASPPRFLALGLLVLVPTGRLFGSRVVPGVAGRRRVGGGAEEGDEHGDGYAGGEAGEGDDVDADDEDDDMCDAGATDVSTSRTDTSHVNTHMNDVTDVAQPDRKRPRGPRGVRGQGHRTGRARAGNED